MYTAPSVKRLVAILGVTLEDARTIRALIHGELAPNDILNDGDAPVYTSYTWLEKVMEALNAVLKGHGVVALYGEYVDRYWREAQAVYINNGESYKPTILYDTDRDRFMLTSWADFVEAHPKRFPR